MTIDVNCDVGEGIQNEHLIMPFISSCNIACGGHFGDKNTILKTIELAIEYNVAIGAHPSFVDKKNFGRQFLNLSEAVLKQSIEEQLDLFLSCLAIFNQKMHHIKPHGALYNLIAKDRCEAQKFIRIIKKYVKDCFLFVPYNSEIAKVALENNIKIKYEAFADRNYNTDLSLVSRNYENALILSSVEIVRHVLKILKTNRVQTVSGLEKEIKADTLCVHGDTENIIEIISCLKTELKKKGIEIGA
tara:strand:- start:1809 stop:2543 length:735 start_codon:yes stop_codon:yes gene_type:complete